MRATLLGRSQRRALSDESEAAGGSHICGHVPKYARLPLCMYIYIHIHIYICIYIYIREIHLSLQAPSLSPQPEKRPTRALVERRR